MKQLWHETVGFLAFTGTLASPRLVGLSFQSLAAFLVLNAITLFLPESWINTIVVWCGVGPVPDAMLFRYLLRGSGVLLLAFASLIWIIGMDVIRYQPLVIAVCLIFLGAMPVSCLINAFVGMPWWWCILLRVAYYGGIHTSRKRGEACHPITRFSIDATICFLGGGIPLAFGRGWWTALPQNRSKTLPGTRLTI